MVECVLRRTMAGNQNAAAHEKIDLAEIIFKTFPVENCGYDLEETLWKNFCEEQ